MKINNLTLEEKIGQMIIVGLEGNSINNRIKKLIKDYKIGGVILYKKNFNTYKDMLKLINDLNELNKDNKIPLFIAIDQEGGRVNRMPKEFLNLPAANKIAKLENLEVIEEAGNIIGKMLKDTGINLVFAPVLDIKNFPDNHALGDRCFGDNVESVSKYGIATMKQIQKNKVISVVKHFPGHGATNKDSHFFLPVVNKNIEELEKEDMSVFENAINQGADAIMVGHLLLKKEKFRYPTSLSRKFITKYLRKRYRYNGIIITDDLKMRAIKVRYGIKKSIRIAFLSGADIIIFRYSENEERRALNVIYKMAEKGELKINRINKAVNRITKIKEKYGLKGEMSEGVQDIDDLNKRIKSIRNMV